MLNLLIHLNLVFMDPHPLIIHTDTTKHCRTSPRMTFWTLLKQKWKGYTNVVSGHSKQLDRCVTDPYNEMSHEDT